MSSSPALLLLLSISITYAAMSDHRGFPSSPKYRGGPPMPPRPPSLPPYVKKWHMPPPQHMSIHGGRYPHRRPHSAMSQNSHGAFTKYGGPSGKAGGFIHPGLTLQMQHQKLQQQQLQTQYLPLQHKGISSAGLPPLSPITKQQSVIYESQRIPQQSNIWNNYKQTNQQQIKTSYNEIAKEKTPFQSSPQISTLEYDDHIQTNNIPNAQQSGHLIKQADDNNGPIHTIPAPKLSLADKPKNMDIQTAYKDLDYQASYPKSHHKQLIKPNSVGHKYTHVTIQKAHQYQVTEAAPLENNDQQHQQVSYGNVLDSSLKQADQLQYQQLESLPQAQFLVQQPEIGFQHHQQPEIGFQQHQQLPSQDIFGVFNSVPQQPLLDVYTLPLGQQHVPFEATAALPNYHNVVGTSHVVQPEYHSFNYQESEHNHQMQQKHIRDGQGQHHMDFIYQQPQLHQLNPQDSQQREQSKPYDIDFVQQFFAQHENSPVESPVRSSDTSQEYTQSKEDAIVNAFYSTLPNKEAAEALASLQEAGKLNTNSHVNQRSATSKKMEPLTKSGSVPMTIYVPDDFDEGEARQKSNISKKSVAKQQVYYENLSEEKDDADGLEDLTENVEFGERIQPK